MGPHQVHTGGPASAPASHAGAVGGIGEDELEVLAGFIVWLARQQIPEPRRGGYHGHVERYLGWRAGPGTHEPTATGFVQVTAGCGAQARHVRASFALLRRYLLAASHRRTGSANPLWSRLPTELAS
jgi:hypothetical protein